MRRYLDKSTSRNTRRGLMPLALFTAALAGGCEEKADQPFTTPGAEPVAGTEYQPPVLSDEGIETAIESELITDSAVNYLDVDVEVAEGIVTLKGRVDNLLAKDRAQRLAETVRGVRSVINRVDVHIPDAPEDAKIQTSIKEALAVDPATESYEVDVEVKNDGQVTLTGVVQSWQENQLVEQVAKGVKGVREVSNDLSIRLPEERDDREIKTEIESALRWNALVDHGLIEVSVKDGKVKLSGVVGSAAEKRQARLSARVGGVETIDDEQLEVSRWARDGDLREQKYVFKSDAEIEEAIQDALVYDPRVSSFAVDVSVRYGVATLRGVVDNLRAKRAAAADARNTVGVGRVENQLKVRNDVVEDFVISEAVKTSLNRDALTSDEEVKVTVDDGWVYLDGTIDSYLGRGRAEDIAAGVKGVKVVVNRLAVWDDTIPYTYDPYLGDPHWESYRITTPERKTLRVDEEIKLSILDEMWWSPFVDHDDVEVEVSNGVAELTGTVDSWAEYEAATQNAFEGGAVWVDNDLVVKSVQTSK